MLAEQPSYLFFALEHPKDLVATVVGLALLLLLLYRFGLPAFKSSLTDRASNIESVIRQADAQLEDIARLRNDYATRIQQIEQEQRERIAAAVRDADTARSEIVADAEEAARTIRRRGDEELARERTRQRILLRQQMVGLTIGAAEAAVKAQNSDTVQRLLIRDFVGMVANNGAPAESFYPAAGAPTMLSAAPATVAAPAPTVAPEETPVIDFATPNFGFTEDLTATTEVPTETFDTATFVTEVPKFYTSAIDSVEPDSVESEFAGIETTEPNTIIENITEENIEDNTPLSEFSEFTSLFTSDSFTSDSSSSDSSSSDVESTDTNEGGA